MKVYGEVYEGLDKVYEGLWEVYEGLWKFMRV